MATSRLDRAPGGDGASRPQCRPMTDAINHEEERPHPRPERSVDGGFGVSEGDQEGR